MESVRIVREKDGHLTGRSRKLGFCLIPEEEQKKVKNEEVWKVKIVKTIRGKNGKDIPIVIPVEREAFACKVFRTEEQAKKFLEENGLKEINETLVDENTPVGSITRTKQKIEITLRKEPQNAKYKMNVLRREISREIKRAMRSKKISIKDLSKYLDVSTKQAKNIMEGRFSDIKILARIMSLTGTRPSLKLLP